MTAYFKSIWSTRFFLLSLVKYDLNTRYRRSLLGVGWSLLQPIGMTIVLCTVFHRLFAVDIKEFGPFLLAGLAFWSFFLNSTLGGCHAFFQAEGYMKQYPVPPAIYPLRVALGAIFHLVMALGIVVLLSWILNGFANLSTLIYLVPTLMLIVIFGWAVATLAGLANTYFPDAQHMVDLALQALFYMTPILYPPALLKERGLEWLIIYNPIASILELIRQPILYAEAPSLNAVMTTVGLVGITAGFACLAMLKLQRQLIHHL